MPARIKSPYKTVPATPVERVVVNIDPELLRTFDDVAAKAGFTSRAAAIRELVNRVAIAKSFPANLTQRAERGE